MVNPHQTTGGWFCPSMGWGVHISAWSLGMYAMFSEQWKRPVQKGFHSLPSGQLTKNYGKAAFLMGKLTNYKWPFSIAMLVYQRVFIINVSIIYIYIYNVCIYIYISLFGLALDPGLGASVSAEDSGHAKEIHGLWHGIARCAGLGLKLYHWGNERLSFKWIIKLWTSRFAWVWCILLESAAS